MPIFALMRLFTIRFRMLGAIAVVLLLMGLIGGVGMLGMLRIQALSGDFLTSSPTLAFGHRLRGKEGDSYGATHEKSLA